MMANFYNNLCDAIKKACRMLYPSEENMSWVSKVMDFVLDKWTIEKYPETLVFSESEFLEKVFDGEDSAVFASDILHEFFWKMDIDIEQESYDTGKGSNSCFFVRYFYDEEEGTFGLWMLDRRFFELTDFIGRTAVSMRRRDIEVRIEVYEEVDDENKADDV